jgi:UDP-galactose transporter B1
MNHLLVAVNTVGIICSILMLTIQGQLKTSFEFCLTHKEISQDLLLYGTLSVAGQVSIYFIILNFKQHIFPLISTSRKVITVLLSIYIYKHPTNVWMWLALVLVFGGLIYELADELYYDLTG